MLSNSYTMKTVRMFLFIAIGILMCLGFLYIKEVVFFKTKHVEETQSMVIEKIEKVLELTRVKGHVSEIYNYKDYYVYDIWPLRKKALIRVKADVSIGYKLDSLHLDINEIDKTIRIQSIPSPEILAIDHELDYYDMSAGIFNIFTNEDITTLSKKAKDFITQQALTSSLYQIAEEQKSDFLELLELFLANTGWKLLIEDKFLD